MQTDSEYGRMRGLRFIKGKKKEEKAKTINLKVALYTYDGSGSSLPSRKDWSDSGIVGPVKIQVCIYCAYTGVYLLCISHQTSISYYYATRHCIGAGSLFNFNNLTHSCKANIYLYVFFVFMYLYLGPYIAVLSTQRRCSPLLNSWVMLIRLGRCEVTRWRSSHLKLIDWLTALLPYIAVLSTQRRCSPLLNSWVMLIRLGRCEVTRWRSSHLKLIDWLTALRHISTERLLVPRNVAK